MVYNSKKFAEWLEAAFQQSSFKSYAAIAEKIGVSRAYVSILAKPRKQPLNAKATQPNAKIVVRLAQVLNKDVNEALLLAGHAPRNSDDPLPQVNLIPILEAFEKAGNLTENDCFLIANFIDFLDKQKAEKDKR